MQLKWKLSIKESTTRGGDSVRERARSVYESVREINCVSLWETERERERERERNRERECVRERVCVSECVRENVSVSECVWGNVQTLCVCVSASVCSSECVYVCLSASSCVWVCVCACMSASMCVCVWPRDAYSSYLYIDTSARGLSSVLVGKWWGVREHLDGLPVSSRATFQVALPTGCLVDSGWGKVQVSCYFLLF